jgi:hypothetical protein
MAAIRLMMVRDPSVEEAGERIANFRVYINGKIRSSTGTSVRSFSDETEPTKLKI